MDIGNIIAENLKKLRKERNLTLGQLSEISGVSKAMLSNIEQGESNPTINTIWKIANGLNVPYTKLMEELETMSTVIKKSDIEVQTDDNEHYRTYCYFKNTPIRNFEFFHVELDSYSSKTTQGHCPRTEEYIYVISGELILQVENEEYMLKEGDALAFDSSVNHSYINNQNTVAIFNVINYYPN